MTGTPFQPQSAQWRRYVSLALIVCLQTQSLTPAWAQSSTPTAPSQNPLISSSNVVPPNLMVTLDTSWSMIFPYMPEGDVKLPGGTVAFPGFTSAIMHPDDTRYDAGQGPALGDGGAIPGDPSSAAGVFQMQMRSPDVNSLYYDPRVTYKPWMKAEKDSITGEYKRYPAADPKRAYFDPDKTSGTGVWADLTLVESAKNAFWCTQNPNPAGDKLVCGNNAKTRQAYALPFNPGLYYRLDGANPACPKVSVAVGGGTAYYPDPKSTLCYTQYNVNKSGASFPAYATRTDCGAKATTCSATAELQNYANWFVYYRTRLHVAQASLPETMLQLRDKKLRAGWATIHKGASVIDGVNTRNVVSGVRTLDATRKQAFVNWVRAFQSDNTVTKNTADPKLAGTTPLVQAATGVGDYFARTDNRSPWATDPEVGDVDAKAALSCRRSYNLLITDGYYTDGVHSDFKPGRGPEPQSQVNGVSTAIANEDNTNGAVIKNPSGSKSYQYTPVKPYQDTCDYTMADVAMYYWKNDLRPDLDNNVPSGKDTLNENPAFWQSLVQFNIGLGVSGNIPYNDLSNQLTLLKAGTKDWWPANGGDACATSRNAPTLVDDLLHAAVNSRGRYFSVKTSTELTNALTTALGRASRQDGMTQSGVSLQTQYVNAINVKYVPEYTSEQWFGDVKAFEYASNGNGNGSWSTKPAWLASDALPPHDKRNIVTWTGGGGANFSWNTLGANNQATLKANLPEGAAGSQLVDYIRGDGSQEDAALQLRLFRQRDGLLADIVNSTPTLLRGNVDLAYDLLPGTHPGQASYAAFRNTKAARPPLLFVGDNGGMLHAFADYSATANNNDPQNPSAARGQEVFAFVPQAAMAGLGNFARRDYGTLNNPHRFLVDGPLTESDAYLNGSWRNVLIGTMGAGGRAIFALDVTPGKTLDANAVMWEKSNADDGDIGYMFGDAQVGMLPDGSWKVFVGNGPYSDKGHAVLIMLDLQTGKIDKVDVSTNSESGNALGAVQLVKNNNQQVIAIYAGDLLGRMWRFDVNSSGSSSTVATGLGGQPLFQAPTGQPITATPSVVAHDLGGYMVLFGTGKLYDDADASDIVKQSLYAVWDAPASVASGQSSTNLSRSDLVEQKILTTAVATNARGQSFFDMEFHDVDYKAKRGWYVDLILANGERLIYPSTLIGNSILMNTVVPPEANDTPTCDTVNGKAYSFLLPIFMDGRYTKTQTIDTNGDGVVDGEDKIASIYSTPANGRSKVTLPAKKDPNGSDTPSKSCGQTGELSYDNHVALTQALKGYSSSLCKIRGRIWRQILTPPQP